MENKPNKYITVAYKMYIMDNDEKVMVEEAPEAHPFQFISGLGFTLERFEDEIVSLNPGDKFNFTIPCAEAYGEYIQANVREVPKSLFVDANGKFDDKNVFEGNVISLQDSEGYEFLAIVTKVTKDIVEVDMNHPHAGKDLTFEGVVKENRVATNKEIESILNEMSDSCAGSCGGCCGGCGSENDELMDDECGCGRGHCH